MSRRLGKKHFQYVGTEGLERLKQDKSHWNPKRSLWDTYKVQILLTHTNLRDKFWCPQNCNKLGIIKRNTPAKRKLHNKLERYYDRAGNGR